jgi:hypothetical protein
MTHTRRPQPPDEIDTRDDNSVVLDEDKQTLLEEPGDPGGLGEINNQPDRRRQLSPLGELRRRR